MDLKKICEKQCAYKSLLIDIKKTADIVNHHGSEIMDACKFRETFSDLCRSIVKKCEELNL